MRLAEAILERDALNMRLETLGSRLRDEKVSNLPEVRVIKEIQQTSNQMRDLSIGIDWTESVNSLLSLTIKGHRIKIKSHFRLAKILEGVDEKLADELWRTAINDSKVVEAATWIIEFQIPPVEGLAKEPQ